MPDNPTLTEVMLQPESSGLGKKCYGAAAVTKETGEFPNKRYFTSNRLRYIGLHTRTERVGNSTRWYFQHSITQEESYIESKPLPLFGNFTAPDAKPQEKIGFVEVMCHGNKIRSLQDLSRGAFQTYVKSTSINDQRDIADLLEHQGITDIVDPVPSTKKLSKRGGKRKKTIKKRRKRKTRKNRRKTARR